MVMVIDEFYYLIEKYPDHPKFLTIYTQYIRRFLQSKTEGETLPTVEIITVLKHEKPLIFSIMRRLRDNNTMNILTSIEMNIEDARTRLNSFVLKDNT